MYSGLKKYQPINLHLFQLMKYGVHVGLPASKIHPTSKHFLKGKKNNIGFINLEEHFYVLKRLIFLIRKMSQKKEKLLIPSKKISNKSWVNPKSIFDNCYKNTGALLTNKEFLQKKIKKNLSLTYRYATKTSFLSQNHFLKRKTGFSRKRNDLNLPALWLGDRLTSNRYSIISTRKKKLFSSVLTNVSEDTRVTHYPLVGNNQSILSLNYFLKIINLALSK